MSHIDSIIPEQYSTPFNASPKPPKPQARDLSPLVLVVGDSSDLFNDVATICDFLDLGIERVTGDEDLGELLTERRPMAVITELDGVRQDGCFVLMTVASYDRGLPVMVLTGQDAAMAGAVDAVEDLWGLRSVVKVDAVPLVGQMVDFLFHAGRRAGVSRLMPV